MRGTSLPWGKMDGERGRGILPACEGGELSQLTGAPGSLARMKLPAEKG